MTAAPRFYTLDDLAEMFGFSRTKTYTLNKSEDWPSLKFGKQFRFTEDQLKQILEMHTRTPQPKERRPRIGTKASKR